MSRDCGDDVYSGVKTETSVMERRESECWITRKRVWRARETRLRKGLMRIGKGHIFMEIKLNARLIKLSAPAQAAEGSRGVRLCIYIERVCKRIWK